MARVALLLATSAALAAWAGAQGPPPPLSAADRVRMLKADRNLLENLVGHGIDLSAADDPLRRAEECRRTARTLANALARAAEDRNGDRVAELADLMGEVVRDGLAPNLEEAAATIPPGDPREPQLARLRAGTAADLDEVGAAGAVGDHRRARDALDRLAALKARIKQ